MGFTKHVAQTNDEAVALATTLLSEGQNVAVVSTLIAPFAMLVNAHGDRLTTLEIDPAELLPTFEEMRRYDLSDHGVDAVIVVAPAQAA